VSTEIRHLLYRARIHERGRKIDRNLDKALANYESVIGIAPTGGRDLRTALAGAARVYRALGQVRMAALYEKHIEETKRRRENCVQLYVSIDDLLSLPYVRRSLYPWSSPGRFNPEKKLFSDQRMVAATIWCQRPYPMGKGRYWQATVFWLKTYDEPGHWPCEAVSPADALQEIREAEE
jgi:hypothetical protein